MLYNGSFQEIKPKKEDAIKIIKATCKYFRNEPNLLYLADPLTIVGDIHG